MSAPGRVSADNLQASTLNTVRTTPDNLNNFEKASPQDHTAQQDEVEYVRPISNKLWALVRFGLFSAAILYGEFVNPGEYLHSPDAFVQVLTQQSLQLSKALS